MSYDDYVRQGLTPDKLMQYMSGIGGGNSMDSLSRNLAEVPTPEQPAQTGGQALAGDSQNADTGPQNNANSINPFLLSSLSQNALNPAQQKQYESDIAERRKGIDYNEGLRQMAAKAPLQTDLSPLLALSDSLTGSNLSKGYTKPQTGEERIGQLSNLEKTSQDQRDKLTQDLVKLATGRNQGRLQSALISNDNRMKTAASRIIPAITNDNVVKVTDTQTNSIQKGLDIMNDIKNGTRVWDTQTKQELEGDFATALQGSRMTGLGSQERATFSPVDSKISNLLGELKGHKINFEDPNAENSYLSQLEQSFGGLHGSISGIKNSRVDALLKNHAAAQAGNPYAQNTIQSIRKQYGVENGVSKASPQTRGNPVPQGVDPKDWNAATPQQQQEFLQHLRK